VELKGFVYVGGARNPKRNLSYDQMPVKDEILAFAERVAALSGYILTEYDKNSKVALLCSDRDAAENRILKFEK
jgi:Wyosine base formation.